MEVGGHDVRGGHGGTKDAQKVGMGCEGWAEEVASVRHVITGIQARVQPHGIGNRQHGTG